MKCLSIRQPFAWLIVHSIKRVENRSWPAPPALIGERIAIHASAGPVALRSWSEIVRGPHIPPEEGVTVGGFELPPLVTLPRGVILGTVCVEGCQRFEDLPKRLQQDAFAEGPICWLLTNALPLAVPISCKGALRLWDVPAGLRLD